MLLHHDEDAEVYLNGKLAAKVTGYTTDYAIYPLSADAAQALMPGQQNSVAIHCHQTGGGQYLDMGLVEVHERK